MPRAEPFPPLHEPFPPLQEVHGASGRFRRFHILLLSSPSYTLRVAASTRCARVRVLRLPEMGVFLLSFWGEHSPHGCFCQLGHSFLSGSFLLSAGDTFGTASAVDCLAIPATRPVARCRGGRPPSDRLLPPLRSGRRGAFVRIQTVSVAAICLGVQSVDLSEDHFHRRLLLADCFGAGGAEWTETHPLRVELQAYLRQVCASGLVHARRRKAHPDRLGARAQFRSNGGAWPLFSSHPQSAICAEVSSFHPFFLLPSIPPSTHPSFLLPSIHPTQAHGRFGVCGGSRDAGYAFALSPAVASSPRSPSSG